MPFSTRLIHSVSRKARGLAWTGVAGGEGCEGRRWLLPNMERKPKRESRTARRSYPTTNVWKFQLLIQGGWAVIAKFTHCLPCHYSSRPKPSLWFRLFWISNDFFYLLPHITDKKWPKFSRHSMYSFHRIPLLSVNVFYVLEFCICAREQKKILVPEFIDPRFRENKPKTLIFSHRKRAFWACFRENWVYNFGHRRDLREGMGLLEYQALPPCMM